MATTESTKGLKHVRSEELKDIVLRRQAYGLGPKEGSTGNADGETSGAGGEDGRSDPTSEVSKDLIGLSLSGGGIRSACFSLGLLQAFHKKGIWKHLDYLSTVSGGTYIGSYLSSLTLSRKKPFSEDDFPLRVGEGDKQPGAVRRFIHGARYLRKPWLMLNKYLVGLFFINLAVFSVIVAACALTSFLWRCLDHFVLEERRGGSRPVRPGFPVLNGGLAVNRDRHPGREWRYDFRRDSAVCGLLVSRRSDPIADDRACRGSGCLDSFPAPSTVAGKWHETPETSGFRSVSRW